MFRFDARLTVAVALLLATVTAVDGQRLMEMEGIELRGTARVVAFGAAICNVSETAETAASYERKKASHGQPIDIWQLDFSVYNGSQKPLGHLIANYQIAAENPPCTNWDMSAAMDYPTPLQWGGAASFIQRSSDLTAPGETLTTSSYVWVFHEHQPRFDTWTLDYTFSAATPGAVAPGGRETRPETLPVSRPLAPAGRAEELGWSVGPGETCAGQPVGSTCWMESSNQPGCHLWNDGLAAGATATWSGECSGGYAQSTGTVHWRYDDGEQTAEGSFADGKQQGNWVLRWASGTVAEGPFVDGERNGDWMWWFTNGNVAEVPYVNGRRYGRAIECSRYPGDVISLIISYVAGDEIDRNTIGPGDPDAPAVRARCSALLGRPRPWP